MLGITIVVLLIGLVSSRFTDETCGIRPAMPAGDVDYAKIVGGVESTAGAWPWSCSLRSNGRHICGGSLINQEWVITAAHCLNSVNPAIYTVVCGVFDRTQSDPWTEIYQIVEVVRHPDYNARYIQNDIGLLKIGTPAVYSDYILPVCFPDATATYAGRQSIASGWGSTFSGGSVVNRQREVSMPVLTDALCRSRFGGTGNPSMIDVLTQVCAGNVGEGKDTCQGDSGGPLVVREADGFWYLVGLTSWGYGCGDGGVYTRCSGYRDWVLSIVSTLPDGTE